MKLVLVGPLPPPVNGCAYANQVLLSRLTALGVQCGAIDTASHAVSSSHGRFSFRKMIGMVRPYAGTWRLLGANVMYATPGQTFLGMAKYAPFFVCAMALGIPYVIHVHGNYLGEQYRMLRGFKRWLFRALIGNASAGIVLSPSLRANFCGLLDESRVFAVENFAGSDIFDSMEEIEKPRDKLHILYLSNLMRSKGILELLSALEVLRDNGIPFQANIAGGLEEETQGEVLARLQSLQGNATFHGVVAGEAKIDLLRKANVFVLPTYYPMEGQPISLLEALASGNIIVTTRHAGIPDVVDERNGMYVEAGSVDALSDALVEISTDVGNMLDRFSSFNRAYAGHHFTEERFSSGVLQVLCNVSGEAARVQQPENL